MKKKIFLAYVYSSKNAGDLAICVGAIDLLIKAEYQVFLLSKYDKKDEEYFSSREFYRQRYGTDLVFLEAPFTLNREGSAFEKLINNFKGILVYIGLGNKRTRIIKKYIKESDFVIFNGGNLLRCASLIDYARLLALYYPIKLGLSLKKPYLIFPQSSAKITGLGRRLLQRFITEAKSVFIRERQSYDKLKSRFNLKNLISTIDLAFFINKSAVINNNKRNDVIAFTLRAHTIGDIAEFDDREKEKIYNSIFKFLKTEKYQKFEIVFVVQTRKDLEFTKIIIERLNKEIPSLNISLYESYDPLKLLNFYNEIQLLVGMRLHSIILASSIGTPCYGLFYKEWGLKNPGLMEHLNMPYTMMDEDAEIKTGEVDYLLENAEKLSRDLTDKVNIEEQKIISELYEQIGK